jgi:hypothetical protein
MRKLAAGLIVLLVLAGLAYAARGYLTELANRAQEQASGQPAASLSDLAGIDQLKETFDSAADRYRLVLLLSPT